MSNITTLFDNEDSSIFYDKKSNELIFKNKDVYYDINITTNNNESQNLKQKINNLFSIVQAIQITGKLGPQGKEGPRGILAGGSDTEESDHHSVLMIGCFDSADNESDVTGNETVNEHPADKYFTCSPTSWEEHHTAFSTVARLKGRKF